MVIDRISLKFSFNVLNFSDQFAVVIPGAIHSVKEPALLSLCIDIGHSSNNQGIYFRITIRIPFAINAKCTVVDSLQILLHLTVWVVARDARANITIFLPSKHAQNFLVRLWGEKIGISKS